MKKLYYSFLFSLVSYFGFSQATLINENFDSYQDFVITGFGSWLTLDLDQLNTYTGGGPTSNTSWSAAWPNAGVPMAFQIFNPSTTTPLVSNNASATTADNEVRNFDPHSGAKYAASWSGVPSSNGQTATSNNDWLISPPLTLGSTGNNLTFWVKSLSNTYGLDQYKVGVYVGTGTPTASSNFTIISGASSLAAPYPNWQQQTFNLDAFGSQTIRIGIQNVSADNYMLMVDDFMVTSTSLSTSEVDLDFFSVYPNPTKDKIFIESKVKINGIRIYDASAKLISEYGNEKIINISGFTKGVYYVNIAFENGELATKKILKD